MNKRSVLLSTLVATLAFFLVIGMTLAAAQSALAATSRSSDVAAPIIENVGQFLAAVRFQIHTGGAALGLKEDAVSRNPTLTAPTVSSTPSAGAYEYWFPNLSSEGGSGNCYFSCNILANGVSTAQVYADLNFNGRQDAGEPTATVTPSTALQGLFSSPLSGPVHLISDQPLQAYVSYNLNDCGIFDDQVYNYASATLGTRFVVPLTGGTVYIVATVDNTSVTVSGGTTSLNTGQTKTLLATAGNIITSNQPVGVVLLRIDYANKDASAGVSLQPAALGGTEFWVPPAINLQTTVLNDDRRLLIVYSDGTIETRAMPAVATRVTTNRSAVLYWFMDVNTADPWAGGASRRFQELWAVPPTSSLGIEYANAGYLLSTHADNLIRIDGNYDGTYEREVTLQAGQMLAAYARNPAPHSALITNMVGHVRATYPVFSWQAFTGNWNGTDEHLFGTEHLPVSGPTTYPISGRITDGSGNPVVGVTISDGAGHTATTDASGNYTFSGLAAGTYTITPSKSGCTFSPTSRSVNVPPSATGQDFTATCPTPTYTITGTITSGGAGLSGVTISDGAGHTTTSDASGNYTLSGLVGGTYTITPSKSGCTAFSPASRSVSVPPSATGQNFTATCPTPTYTITGQITSGGAGLSGVTISDGAGHTATSDASGNYTFSGLPAGAYTLTPSKGGCTAFSPASRSVTLPPNATGQNFTATCGTPPSTRVKILPALKRASLSGTFTVTLWVENVTNLGAFQTELTYTPATVHVTAVTLGAFLGGTGRTVTPVGPTIDNTAGKVTFGAFSFGAAAGPSGSGVLAVITFQPRAVGTTALHLQNLGLADPNGNAIAAATEDGQAQITNCFGDFDGDNDVDIFDLQRAAGHWNCRTGDACYDAQYDTEPDGDIDVFDLQRFAAAWGTTCTTAAAQRKTWPALALAASPEASASADLSLSPATRQAAPGEIFTQTVRLTNAANVGAFQTTLTYDPAVAQVEAVTLGAFLGSTGRTVVPVGPTIDNVAGQVTFGAFTFGSQAGVSGAGDLAYVRFRAGAAGRTSLTFQGAGLSDPQGNALPLGSQAGAEVTVGTQANLMLLPSAQVATVGREFSVTLRVSDAANLAAFQTAIAYNPAVAQATEVALGPF